VLDFSKIEAGQLTLSNNPYSLKEVIQAVVAGTQPLATEKNLPLNIVVPSYELLNKAQSAKPIRGKGSCE
jgi:signal transduction histidine kinase